MYKKIYRGMCFLSIFSLIVVTLFILTVAYTTVNSKLKGELREETVITAGLLERSGDIKTVLSDSQGLFSGKRVTLISPSGEVFYDSISEPDGFDDHNKRPEVIEARKTGIGEAERFSVTSSKKYYYCAVRLEGGSVFRMASSVYDVYSVFFTALILVLVMMIFIYILSSFIASRLTENILRPIARISVSEGDIDNSVYEELKPLIQRISSQNTEIKRQMEKVKEQKMQLQTITDNMNEGFAILDENGTVLSVNKSALAIFDVDRYAVKNVHYSTFIKAPALVDALGSAFSGEHTSAMFEKGSSIYRGIFSPVKYSGKMNGIIVLLFDITATAEAERMRREFSANVSHELRTPLTTIHGYSQIISSGMASGEDAVSFAAKIERESSRMITLVEDIMRLSNLDENASANEKSSFSLKKAVLDAVGPLSDAAAARGINLRTEGADCTVSADRRQVTELIYDLCDNAIKYNKDGGSVTVTVSENQVSVADTGIGIPAEYLDRIFERFFRVDKSRSRQVNGTGLGLSIVKHLAQANDIEIKVSSRVGEGSIFTLILNNTDIRRVD